MIRFNIYCYFNSYFTDLVNALVIIPSNENIVCGSFDKTIKVWNSTTFQLIATLTGHTDWVNTLAIILSNENIVSGSSDQTINIWKLSYLHLFLIFIKIIKFLKIFINPIIAYL